MLSGSSFLCQAYMAVGPYFICAVIRVKIQIAIDYQFLIRLYHVHIYVHVTSNYQSGAYLGFALAARFMVDGDYV